jgi:NAD(P)H-hydrate epimerase
VRVALLGAAAALHGDARLNCERWSGPVEPLQPAILEGAAVVVDALFGSGLNRPLDPAVAALLAAVAQRRAGAGSARRPAVVAVDVPSGVNGDSGEAHGAIAADCTVTFVRKKPGHLLLPGRTLCGDLIVADIGTPAAALDDLAVMTCENEPSLWRTRLPQLTHAGNKFQRGHALLYGGYPTTGAARMAARGAARAGAGLTTIAVGEAALPVYAAALTSIMVRPLAAPGDLGALLADARFNALLIGPGAGVGEQTRQHALAMLATGRAVVLDADAITVFKNDAAGLRAAIHGPCVLTPHDGEFARVFDPSGDKLQRARRAAAQSGAIIVLKGADTVIAAPDGRALINANAPPTLATAGAGDVLGGFVLGLLSQGMDAFDAAAAAVWMHGAAAADFGPGLLAEDLPDLLPAVLRRLA